MTYDHLSQPFKISAQNERLVRLIFPKQFAQILGLDSSLVEKPIGNEENVFKFNAKLNHNFRNFYVNSDIASFTFIGDTVAPILRVVPFQSKPDSYSFYKELETLHYVSVSNSIVDQVHITLKTENGMIVPFVTGKTILKLERKKLV